MSDVTETHDIRSSGIFTPVPAAAGQPLAVELYKHLKPFFLERTNS